MKKLVSIVLIVFSVSMVFASDPESRGPVTAKTSQIEGKVFDSTTGEALAGVSLKLKNSNIKTYSDLNGNFSIEDVAPGTYDIEIDYVSYKDITLKKVSATAQEVKLKVALESVSPEI